MAGDKENNLAAMEKRRQAFMDRYAAADTSTPMVPNPAYKSNPFDPNAYLEQIPADPKLAQPLPSGRAITPSMPSDVNALRINNIQEYRNNPEGWFAENTQLTNNEQSLLDKGIGLMGRIFDYRDESDLELFGVNLSAVESVHDAFLARFVGGYDLLNAGMGALVSAAPGGIRTLEFSELTGGKDVGQVLSGEMGAGDAPSIGQIAIASIAVEAKRIREGNARLSDVLLANPATAPFILAALKADTSPLQQEGFDIMNKEQRQKAFGSGFEQWFSGITDAGMIFADPLIGVGVGAKAARVGMLGTRGGSAYGRAMGTAVEDLWAKFDAQFNQSGVSTKDAIDAMVARGEALASGKSGPSQGVEIADSFPLQNIDASMPRPTDPLGGLFYDVLKFKPNGTKELSVLDISNRLEIKNSTQRMAIASVLYQAKTYGELGLVVMSASGVPGASKKLTAVAASLEDEISRVTRADLFARARSDPQQLTEIDNALNANISELDAVINKEHEFLTTSLTEPYENGFRVKPGMEREHTAVTKKIDSYLATRKQAEEMKKMLVDGIPIDPLNPAGSTYNATRAKMILDDLTARREGVDLAIDSAINNQFLISEFPLITKNNAYARMVAGSRSRRAKAASQYAQEKTAIFPRNGQGWFAQSTFEGTNRFQRNLRVWRWMGTERPVGLIGLHGTATVGADRELLAATDLAMYRGKDPVEVTVNVWNRDGQKTYDPVTNKPMTETVMVGGQQARRDYIARYAAAINDPLADNFQVLQQIEFDIANDFAKLHNLNPSAIEGVMKQGNRDRVAHLDMLRKEAKFVDPVDGSVSYIPVGPEQLANSTYMQNFQAMEKILKKSERTPGGLENVRSTLEDAGYYGAQGYKLFNDMWRPATLLRISYMNRNILDGVVRSMAYSGSLAPLLWPLKATAFGVRNKGVRAAVERQVASTGKLVERSEYVGVLRQFNEADQELARLKSAQPTEPVIADGVETPMVHIWSKDKVTGDGYREVIPESEWRARMLEQGERTAAMRTTMQANVEAYDKAVSGTAFGKWRKKNLEDLDARIREHESLIQIFGDGYQRRDIDGNILEPTIAETNKIAEIAAINSVNVIRRNDLKYNPTVGAQMYRDGAGRARRIGSGTSVGPGGYYDDAFVGPYEQLNRRMLSSDSTRKAVLTLSNDVWTSIYRRSIITDNVPIAWDPKNAKAVDTWAIGLAKVLERASSNAFVRHMVTKGWDEDAGVAWLTASSDGKAFYEQVRKMFGEEGASINPNAVMMEPFGKELDLVTGGAVTLIDPEEARTFVRSSIAAYRSQTFNIPEFETLLATRVKSKLDNRGGGQAIDGRDVKTILDSLADKSSLGFVQGSEIIDMGTDSARNAFTRITSTLFKYLGTIPEDSIVRGPFYNSRFKETRNTLIQQYFDEMNITVPRRRAFGASGRDQGLSLEHPQFDIPADRMSEIMVQSHRQALALTRKYMYTIERQTNLGKYGEWLFPFITAQQNTYTVAGQLLMKNPWLAPLIADIWRMPNRLGWEDEEGNLQLPMPAEWVTNALEDATNIPVIGGVLNPTDIITIPKNGLNVWASDSGMGLIPRPGAWVQVGASQLMKWGMLPNETPQVVRMFMPNDADSEAPSADADAFYQTFKDWIFGEDSGVSSKPGSWDKLFPAYAQKLIYSKQELSNQYGYKYAIHSHTQYLRYWANERPDAPTEEELHKRTTNSFWLDFFGNQGIATPLTPYPIFTRPVVQSPPAEFAQEMLQMYRQVDPVNADENMSNQLGDWAVALANTKITRNVSGADAVPESVTDAKTFDSLIRKVSSSVLEENLDVIGLIVNNRESSVDYEKSAYEMQMAMNIPGSNRKFREVQSPEQSTYERQRVIGWLKYRKAMDQYDARLQSMGLSSYEVNAASGLKAAKSQFIAGMLADPELQGWAVDYRDAKGSKTTSAIRAMELAVSDDTFVTEMSKTDKTNAVLNIMREYTDYRRMLVDILKKSGHNIDHEDNVLVKQAWANMRQEWKGASVRWSEIASLYLSGDDNPVNPGSVVTELMSSPVASVSGVS